MEGKEREPFVLCVCIHENGWREKLQVRNRKKTWGFNFEWERKVIVHILLTFMVWPVWIRGDFCDCTFQVPSSFLSIQTIYYLIDCSYSFLLFAIHFFAFHFLLCWFFVLFAIPIPFQVPMFAASIFRLQSWFCFYISSFGSLYIIVHACFCRKVID